MHVRGAYTADRAAALSGVPKSTVHYWAGNEILIPSVSVERIKLWSYSDLMGLRVIHWLRDAKPGYGGHDVPRSSMPSVKRALAALRDLNLTLWSEGHGPRVAVDRKGEIYLRTTPLQRPSGQSVIEHDQLNLQAPFPAGEERTAPDLVEPRPWIRIVPGKLGGAPHVRSTRIETEALAALARRGLRGDRLASLYPMLAPAAIADALDLETELAEAA
jgi:uncharacterized protein (DUF433 family)